ncbi:MAG TPA: hypothetical protein HPP83_12310 [Candidatus Hydrogenedentes bacterium]|nr:hypothetical protein [Candidatus Hydrogenedentota bacterium]
MKDLEKWLRARALAKPPENLGKRMERLFAAPPAPRRRLFSRPVALWQSVAACVLFALGGYWLHGNRTAPEQRHADAPSTVYIIQSGPIIPSRVFDATVRKKPFLGDPAETSVLVVPALDDATEKGTV